MEKSFEVFKKTFITVSLLIYYNFKLSAIIKTDSS